MKQILITILSLMILKVSYSQAGKAPSSTTGHKKETVEQVGNYAVDSSFISALRDTTYHPYRAGAITQRPQTGVWYGWDSTTTGKRWERFAMYSDIPTSESWSKNGNTIVDSNYIGTINAKSLVMKAAGVTLGVITGNGNYNIYFGKDAYASGVYATSFGRKDTASGSAAFASGNTNTASGNVSTAMGEATLANGDYAMAVNHSTTASGYASFSANEGNVASGTISAAFGYNNRSKSFGGTVLGTFNDSTNATDPSFNLLNRAFQIGNGTANNARSNAMTVLFNGQIGIGTVTPNSTALVDLYSTTRGFLPPRMTAAQASLITSPAQGLMIFVTSTDGTFTSIGWWGYGTSWKLILAQ